MSSSVANRSVMVGIVQARLYPFKCCYVDSMIDAAPLIRAAPPAQRWWYLIRGTMVMIMIKQWVAGYYATFAACDQSGRSGVLFGQWDDYGCYPLQGVWVLIVTKY